MFEQGVHLDDPSMHTTVGNAGPGRTLAGIETIVGDKSGNPDPGACEGAPRPPTQPTTVDVVSVAPVTLETGAEVTGSVLTTSQPTVQSGAKIDGAVTIRPGPLFRSLSWSVTFPAVSGADLNLDEGRTASLAPGSYGTVTVAQGATLSLVAGTYTFVSLSVDTGGIIQGNTSSSPLLVYVQTSLHLYGSILPSGGPSTFLLGYAGTSNVLLESAFSGTFVARKAALTLASLASAGPGQQAIGHRGAFFAASLDVHQCVNVGHVPFGGWSPLLIHPGSVCVTPQGGGVYVALFGYSNQNSTTALLSVGLNNTFASIPGDGQPDVFFPTTVPAAFAVAFDGNPITWSLAGGSATASAQSPACSKTPCSTPCVHGQQCVGGQCVTECGDGLCAGRETCTSCPADCGCPASMVCADNGCGKPARCGVDWQCGAGVSFGVSVNCGACPNTGTCINHACN